jgi:hypothetical protein
MPSSRYGSPSGERSRTSQRSRDHVRRRDCRVAPLHRARTQAARFDREGLPERGYRKNVQMSGGHVEIVDAASGFAAVAAAATPGDALAAWPGYERDNRSVFDLYFTKWGDRATVADAVPKVASVASNALDDLPSLLGVADAVSRDLVEIFGDAPSTIRIVLLVGVGMSNAWVADFEGAPTAFFALEQMPPPPLNSALIAHEVAHIFHAHLRLVPGKRRLPESRSSRRV